MVAGQNKSGNHSRANARSIKRRVRHIERQMGRLTENDKMTEMRKKRAKVKEGKGLTLDVHFSEL